MSSLFSTLYISYSSRMRPGEVFRLINLKSTLFAASGKHDSKHETLLPAGPASDVSNKNNDVRLVYILYSNVSI